MIRRNSLNYVKTQESLNQSSTTAIKGVDATKAPTTPDTVLNIDNLDVDYDGGLVLRKPLIMSEGLEDIPDLEDTVAYSGAEVYTAFRLYNGDLIYVLKHDEGYTFYSKTDRPIYIEATDVYGSTAKTPASTTYGLFDLSNVRVVNTNTSTVVGNVIVNFEKIPEYERYTWEYEGSSAFNSLINAKRYLKITYSDVNEKPCIIITIVRPEPNTLRESDSVFVYNQNLDDVFAIRDVYDSSYVNINGIVPYRTSDIVSDKTSVYYIGTSSASPTYNTVTTPSYLAAVKFETYTWDATSNTYILEGYADFSNYIPNGINVDAVYTYEYYVKCVESELGRVSLTMRINVWTATQTLIAYRTTSLQKALDEGAFIEPLSVYFRYQTSGTVSNNRLEDATTGQILEYFLESKDSTNPDSDVRLNISAVTDCLLEIKTASMFYRVSLNKGDSYTTSYDVRIANPSDSTPYVAAIIFLDSSKVLDVTENLKSNIIETFDKNNLKNIFLKAYLSIVPNKQYYCIWEKSDNGTDWTPVVDENRTLSVAEPESVSDELSDTTTVVYRKINVQPFLTNTVNGIVKASPTNLFITRPDVLYLKSADVAEYRFRILEITDEISEYEDRDGNTFNAFKLKTVLASKSYVPQVDTTEVSLDRSDFVNTTSGEKFYYKKRIYTYGSEFKNNIHVSEFDEFTTNITNVIDLDTHSNAKVTGITAWRDFLITYTDKTIHLTTLQDGGFFTKTLSASVGIPEFDSKTCVSILNGIMFKSDSKIYSMYPNFSSGSETILNISEISRPIEHILKKLKYNTVYRPFAFIDSESYYLFVPQIENTRCLKYDFTHRIWTSYSYDVVIYDYAIVNAFDIRLYAEYNGRKYEYYFNKDYSDLDIKNIDDSDIYGDLLDSESIKNVTPTPIKFLIDSGHKTDNLVLTKQFVESKIIVATLNPKDSFKLDVRIDVEGNTLKRHIDLNTDGALLRNSDGYLLTLGTATEHTYEEDFLGTVRQMFLRYSGKGKTIRHIISGQSLYKFKIYEILYRYKILNIKQ